MSCSEALGCSHTSLQISIWHTQPWYSLQWGWSEGYVFTLVGGPIAWQSQLQPTVTLSSMQAE
ncbi:hypothetical protein CROQUDRAFT_101544 [Cronartium quercuum f. sp. fusiforme G11]|uniref:Uncharacterized protein n=1 Tax=Cronartium quercuum f. sp. fusiforme G11 TaxID=708437 RepID=A0A9P6N5T4_9BASI|nr:hypothetical protein CROQUDRAFT_101544 [Cronartium quercuum f. sp. fusiforme G11]